MKKKNLLQNEVKIYTKRLLLVPLGLQFLISTHKYAADIENTKYMVHLPNINIDETKSFLDNVEAEWQKQSPQFYEYAILFDNEHIGAISLYMNEDYTEGELGWIINKEYWGNGYASEAAQAMIDFGIQKLNICRFIAHCDSENVNSFKVMEKLGMSLECKASGRKNKLSDEDREELIYSLEVTQN